MTAITGFAKRWQILPNKLQAAAGSVLAQSQDLLYGLFRALQGSAAAGTWYDTDGNVVAAPSGGCTIVTSSDSTTAGAGNKIDNAGELVWAAAGVAHSWFAVNFPEIDADAVFVFDCTDASSYNLNVYVLPTGIGVAGTTLNRPTAADQYAIATTGAPRWGSPSAINIATRWHFWLAADGTGFRFTTSRFNCENILLEVQGMVDSPAEFTKPFMATFHGSGDRQVVGNVTYNSLQEHSANARWKAFLGAAVANCRLIVPANYTAQMPNSAPFSELTSKWQLYPVSVANIVTPNIAPLGSLPDVWCCLNDGTSYRVCGGVTFPDDQSTQIAMFGAFAYPWPQGIRPIMDHLGGSATVGGVSTHSMLFDGSNEYVDLGANYDTAGGSRLSVSAWVCNNSVAGNRTILGKQTSAAAAGWHVWLESSTRIHFTIQQTSGTDALDVYANVTDILPQYTWHHVLVTYDGSKTPAGVHIYVDGVDKGLTTGTNNFTGSSASGVNLAIGRRGDAAEYFNGWLDEVALWSGTELTQGDATAIFNNGEPTDLSAYATLPSSWWKMGEGVGAWPTIPDDIGAIDGTATNMETADRTLATHAGLVALAAEVAPQGVSLAATTYYMMIANSSVSGALVPWSATGTPDWAGASFPGPGVAVGTAISGQRTV